MLVEVLESVPESAHVIRNLYPLYLYDLSEFGGHTPNEHGVYEPEPSVRTLAQQGDLTYQRVWWEKPGVLFPFLVMVDGRPGGFVLICASPYAPPAADYSVQEFFLLRPHRGSGIAEQVALTLFDRFRGRWEFSVLPRNARALTFWSKVIGRYSRGQFTKVVGGPECSAMHIFRFENPRIGGDTSCGRE
jgi:predicted acetyltransferase